MGYSDERYVTIAVGEADRAVGGAEIDSNAGGVWGRQAGNSIMTIPIYLDEARTRLWLLSTVTLDGYSRLRHSRKCRCRIVVMFGASSDVTLSS